MIAEPFLFQIAIIPIRRCTSPWRRPRGAFGRYDMDYWGNCVLEATEWAASQAERAGMPLGIASNAGSPRHGRRPVQHAVARQQRHTGWHLNVIC
jgi:hypothetical protein